MPIPANLRKHLAALKLRHTVVAHRTVFTAYDLANTLKRKLSDVAKTLVVKADRSYVLVVLPAHYRLDLKKLKAVLKAKTVTLANERVMQQVFRVKPGAMTAFGTLHKIPVLMERALAKTKRALFSAGSFTESLELAVGDYVKSEEPTVASFSAKSMPETIRPPKPQAKRKVTKRVSRGKPARRRKPSRR